MRTHIGLAGSGNAASKGGRTGAAGGRRDLFDLSVKRGLGDAMSVRYRVEVCETCETLSAVAKVAADPIQRAADYTRILGSTALALRRARAADESIANDPRCAAAFGEPLKPGVYHAPFSLPLAAGK